MAPRRGSGGRSESHSLVCAHADRGARAALATPRMMPGRGGPEEDARSPGRTAMVAWRGESISDGVGSFLKVYIIASNAQRPFGGSNIYFYMFAKSCILLIRAFIDFIDYRM